MSAIRFWWNLYLFLLFEGVFCTVFTLGWAFGFWSGQINFTAYVLIGVGIGSLMCGYYVWRYRYQAALRVRRPEHSVDIDNQLDEWPPFSHYLEVFNEPRLRCLLVNTEASFSCPINVFAKVVVHHLGGPDIIVSSPIKNYKVVAGELLRFHSPIGDIHVGPSSSSKKQDRSKLLMYLVSNE